MLTTTPASDRAQQTWQAHYAAATGFRYWPCEELVRTAAQHFYGTVVEVGCGNGANLWYLAQRADHVVGLDFCPEALDAARAYMVERGVNVVHRGNGRVWSYGTVSTVLADLRAPLPLSDGRADLLVDAMTSQHLPWIDHRRLYAEYRRVLTIDGRLFLYHLDAGTTGAGQEGPDVARLPLFPAAGLTCLPSPRALVAAVEAAGFRVVDQRGLAREYGSGKAKDSVAHYTILEAIAR